jgi:hypothetical protein
VREMLDIWSALPIVIEDWEMDGNPRQSAYGVDNIMAALEHRDRVCQINLENVPPILFERDSVTMESSPALTHLFLSDEHTSFLVLPDSFLGGSAPRLRQLVLEAVPVPALPRLLLSTNDLVQLNLWNIPHSGYIPPDAMITCLSSVTRLEILFLGFDSPNSLPHESSRRVSSVRVSSEAMTYRGTILSKMGTPPRNHRVSGSGIRIGLPCVHFMLEFCCQRTGRCSTISVRMDVMRG